MCNGSTLYVKSANQNLKCLALSTLKIAWSPRSRNGSHDPDHTDLGDSQFVRQILHVANQYTKFEVSSFSHTRDISGGVKFENVSRDPDHAPFRDDLSSAGWDLLPPTYSPNLKFLTIPTMKNEKRCKMYKLR